MQLFQRVMRATNLGSGLTTGVPQTGAKFFANDAGHVPHLVCCCADYHNYSGCDCC